MEKKRHICSLKTTAVSLGIALTVAAGLYCLLTWFVISATHGRKMYPIAYPASVIGGMLAFYIFIGLLAVYYFLRKRNFSVKGLLIDMATCIVFVPVFYIVLAEIIEKLRPYI